MKNKNLFLLNPFENLMPNWADTSNRKINHVSGCGKNAHWLRSTSTIYTVSGKNKTKILTTQDIKPW